MQLFSRFTVVFSLACLVGRWTAHAQVTSSSRTVVLNGNASYFVPGTPVSSLNFASNASAMGALTTLGAGGTVPLIPFSVFTTSNSTFGPDDLSTFSALWAQLDDVWTSAFLQGIYVEFSSSGTSSLSAGGGTSIVLSSDVVPLTSSIPPGPYFVDPLSGLIFEAWLLYNDEQQSFLYGTVPDGNGGFTELSAHIRGASTVSVAVPSRLYFTPTPQQPLAGTRWCIKDLADIKGLFTGGGNRAFYNFFPVKNETAPSIQRLIDGGAIIVGKCKASQFANGESATDDWVDYHAPYNPRGDGYQDGSSSSTGSGTAIGAYPWLDYAIGTDTGGSMRGPAGANGVYGNRPSHGAANLDLVLPLSPALDTMGIFSRDAKAWQTAGSWLYDNFTSFSSFPKTILFPVDEWGSSFLTTPPKNGTSDAIFNTFIQKLEGFLNTTRTEINITTMWNNTSPLIANVSNPPPTLRTVLNLTYEVFISLDQFSLLAEPFMTSFAAANGGQLPFIDPAPLVRWAFGQNLTNQTQSHIDAVTNKTVFMNWFQETVLNGTDPETCSPAIYLYPQSDGSTFYRNQYINPPTPPFGFSAGRAATHAEVPDMVVPIGELPYNSTITNTTEVLPVTISFITQKNCDLMLFNLFAALQDAGILSPVKTGQSMFQ